jgi:hypothetical protein
MAPWGRWNRSLGGGRGRVSGPIYKNSLSFIRSALGRREISLPEKHAVAPASKSVLREAVKEMGLKSGEYDLRFNRGGSAVHGDATLHTDNLYIQLSTDTQLGVLVRSCQGRKDYSGGPNQWIGWEKFLSQRTPSDMAKRVLAMPPPPKPLGRPTEKTDMGGFGQSQQRAD